MLDEMFGGGAAARSSSSSSSSSSTTTAAATATATKTDESKLQAEHPGGQGSRQSSSWAGKLIVVTGGAGAIGSEVCRYALQTHLMAVAVVDVNAAQVQRVVDNLKSSPHHRHPNAAAPQVHGFVSDVTKLEDQQRLVRSIKEATGMTPHIVLLCAGINRSSPLLQTPPSTMRATMDANFWGVYNGVMAFYPAMERAEGGCSSTPAKRGGGGGSEQTPQTRRTSRHIVSVASMAGVCQCMGTYGVSKHAVVGVSESFELELTQRGSPVSMACMVPGWIKTADPFSLGDVPPSRVAEEMFDSIAKGRFLMTTHPDLIPVSLRGRLDYLLPHHEASTSLGNAELDSLVKAAEMRRSPDGRRVDDESDEDDPGGWSYERHIKRPSDVLHVALADTAKGFSSEILGSFATEYVDNKRLLARIADAKAAEAQLLKRRPTSQQQQQQQQQQRSEQLTQPPVKTAAVLRAAAAAAALPSHFRLDGRDAQGGAASCEALISRGWAEGSTKSGLDLTGRRALVTGASRGIGESLALSLSACGCSVVLTSRSEVALHSVAERCRAAGAPEAEVCPCDLGNAAAVAQLCDRVLADGRTIDILVNCAGIALLGSCLEGDPALSATAWPQLMQINLLTPMMLSQRCAPGMKAKRSGFILNVGSESGTTTQSMVPVYAASKHGLRGWSYNCHNELRPHGIRVLCVNPDWVNTPMIKSVPGLNGSKVLQCTDIAHLVIGALRLPGSDPLADVSAILTDKQAPWR